MGFVSVFGIDKMSDVSKMSLFVLFCLSNCGIVCEMVEYNAACRVILSSRDCNFFRGRIGYKKEHFLWGNALFYVGIRCNSYALTLFS